MTIAERQAREARDKENPWRPMHKAKPGGLICELLFDDMAGHFETEEKQYFLDHDGSWYRLDPPERIYPVPMNWRPAYVQLTPERRALLKRRAQEDRA
jgi:hypothetical protein